MEKKSAIIEKLNVKSISLIIALLLICSGIYMCLSEISHNGSIDIKSSILSGKIETGSLGLLIVLFGTLIILSVIKKSGIMQEKKGEKIEISIGDKKIITENLSFRKVQEIREILKESSDDST